LVNGGRLNIIGSLVRRTNDSSGFLSAILLACLALQVRSLRKQDHRHFHGCSYPRPVRKL
jgi:hypothetical protein